MQNSFENKVNVTDLLNSINDKVASYSDVKEMIGNNDYLELLSDNITILKGLSSLERFIKKRRLAHFLKGLSFETEPTEPQLKKLHNFISNEKTAEEVTKIINNSLSSQSNKASFLLGLVSSKIINSKLDISHIELIAINGLAELNDYDLENIRILRDFQSRLKSRVSREGWFRLDKTFVQWSEELEVSVTSSLFLTVEKCVSLQLIYKEYSAVIDRGEYGIDDVDIENEELLKFTDSGAIIKESLRYLD